MTRRSIIAAGLGALALAAGLIAAPTAGADVNYVPKPDTTSIVTQLGLHDGNGNIDVQVRQLAGDEMTAVRVHITTAGGVWQGRTVDVGSVHCRSGAGPTLDYVCRPSTGQLMPVGDYHLVLPVHRVSGSTVGVWGAVSIDREPYVFASDSQYTEQTDTFPVIDKATDTRSTAEVRALVLNDPQRTRLGRGTLSITITVAPGELVDEVDVRVPAPASTAWAQDPQMSFGGPVLCLNALPQYSPPGQAEIECLPNNTPDESFVPGTHTYSVPLAEIGDPVGTGTVLLRRDTGEAFPVDSFDLAYPLQF